ncbi:hypothetical protein ACFL5X_03400 [Candidatus Omnitrophota bacterium]
MSKINVFIVHGIGVNQEGYADSFIKAIRDKFNSQINEILESNDNFTEQLNIKPIVWDNVLGEKQKKLKAYLEKQFVIGKIHIRSSSKFIKVLISIGYLILKLIDRFVRTSFVSEFIGDVISYKDRDAWSQIYNIISDELNNLNVGAAKENLTLVAHSLGTVISADCIRDQQEASGRLHEKVILSNFFTMGSPIALFSLDYAPSGTFKKPIKIEDEYGKWINLLDDNDPIGYSIKDLDEDYRNAVFIDKKVDVGCYGIAHIKYWTDEEVHKIISRKLAIDWLRLNKKLDKNIIDKLYIEYVKMLEEELQ